MREIVLDCARLKEREAAHRYLREALDLPEHYGGTLDALYDCLWELGRCRIVLQGAGALRAAGGYGARILETFGAAAAGDPWLTVEES